MVCWGETEPENHDHEDAVGLNKSDFREVKIWGKSLQGNEKKLLPVLAVLIESPAFIPI